MTSTKLTLKCKLILLHIGHEMKPPKEVGVIEGTWKQIEQYAYKQVELYEYTTWTIKETRARKNVRKL